MQGRSFHRRVCDSAQVGLSTGVLLRCSVDPVTGALSEGRARFLGGRAPRLFSLKSAGSSSLIALSSKTWMLAPGGQKGAVDAPLLYDTLESIASFASEQVTRPPCRASKNTP